MDTYEKLVDGKSGDLEDMIGKKFDTANKYKIYDAL